MRISGDSPLIDWRIVDKILKLFNKSKDRKLDIVTNVFPRTFESGNSAELINVKTLKKYSPFMNENEREHVTKYFYKNFSMFNIKNLKNNKKRLNIKLSIDTKKDLINLIKFIKKNED